MRAKLGGVLMAGASLLMPFLPTQVAGGATFPGGNGKIVFLGYPFSDAGQHSQIYSVSKTGGARTKLTNTPKAKNEQPEWSPNGKKIVFARRPDGRTQDWDLMIMNADGSGVKGLTNTGAKQEKNPTYSPDGKKIAFEMTYQGTQDIYILTIATGDIVRFTDNGDDNTDASWSPDGTMIAYSRDVDDIGLGTIEVDALDHSAQYTIPKGESSGSKSDAWPNWSPDGTKIVFTRYQTFQDSEIFVAHVGSSKISVEQLTDNGTDTYDRAAAFSPNGAKIVFSRADGEGDGDLYLMNAEGGGESRLTTASVTEFDPNWQATPIP